MIAVGLVGCIDTVRRLSLATKYYFGRARERRLGVTTIVRCDKEKKTTSDHDDSIS
jgi:hypothetical protein